MVDAVKFRKRSGLLNLGHKKPIQYQKNGLRRLFVSTNEPVHFHFSLCGVVFHQWDSVNYSSGRNNNLWWFFYFFLIPKTEAMFLPADWPVYSVRSSNVVWKYWLSHQRSQSNNKSFMWLTTPGNFSMVRTFFPKVSVCDTHYDNAFYSP